MQREPIVLLYHAARPYYTLFANRHARPNLGIGVDNRPRADFANGEITTPSVEINFTPRSANEAITSVYNRFSPVKNRPGFHLRKRAKPSA